MTSVSGPRWRRVAVAVSFLLPLALLGVGAAPAAAAPPTDRLTPVEVALQLPPSAPTGVTATPGDASAVVSWTAPASDGGSPITGYTATSSLAGRAVPASCTTTGALSCTVTGLTNGIPYTFTVTAANAPGGTGPASAPSAPVTPFTVPESPTGVIAAPGDASALVSWTAPAFDGGSPITGYIATSSPDGRTCTTSGAHFCMITGLANGTRYSFIVRATNAAGTGKAAYAADVVVPSAPAPPTATITALPAWLAATAVPLRWTAVAGSSAVASFEVRFRRARWNGSFGLPTTWQSTTPATSATFWASPGFTYCFSVRARDTLGALSGWTAETCTAIPLDERALVRSRGWTAGSGAAYYRSTILRSSTSGAKLTRTGVVARRVALLATTCRTCGTVKVYWGATLLRMVSLYSATTVDRALIPVRTFAAPRSGTLSIKVVSSGKKVIIDGVAIRRS